MNQTTTWPTKTRPMPYCLQEIFTQIEKELPKNHIRWLSYLERNRLQVSLSEAQPYSRRYHKFLDLMMLATTASDSTSKSFMSVPSVFGSPVLCFLWQTGHCTFKYAWQLNKKEFDFFCWRLEYQHIYCELRTLSHNNWNFLKLHLLIWSQSLWV